MFDADSRYFDIEDAMLVTAEGREITYKKRRFLPHGEDIPKLVEQVVQEGDRLDVISGRLLGEARQNWRLSDANDAMYPPDLVVPGQVLKIPSPQM